MSHLLAVEAAFRALVFGDADSALVTDVFGDVDVTRRRLYRELVQNNLHSVLRRACPHAVRLAGEAAFDVVIDRFLASQPVTVRFTREIPGAFTAWLMAQPSSSLPDPSFAELCHFEALEVEITLAKRSPHIVTPLRPGARLVIDDSARLAIYRHPVHRVTSSTSSWPAPSPLPSVLLCFQRDEVLVVEPLSLALGKVLLHAANGATVDDAVGAVVAEVGAVVDVGTLRAQLVGLHHRGAIAHFDSSGSTAARDRARSP